MRSTAFCGHSRSSCKADFDLTWVNAGVPVPARLKTEASFGPSQPPHPPERLRRGWSLSAGWGSYPSVPSRPPAPRDEGKRPIPSAGLAPRRGSERWLQPDSQAASGGSRAATTLRCRAGPAGSGMVLPLLGTARRTRRAAAAAGTIKLQQQLSLSSRSHLTAPPS